jgi:hypothetical protein
LHDLLCLRLDQIIALRHALAKLARTIDGSSSITRWRQRRGEAP